MPGCKFVSLLYLRCGNDMFLRLVYTCVSKTHNSTRYLSMYGHHFSQAIPAFTIKACELATKSHMFNFCKTCAAICCDCDLWEPITKETKRFSVLRKKEQEQSSKQKKYNSDFRKVVISNSIPDALRDLHTSK